MFQRGRPRPVSPGTYFLKLSHGSPGACRSQVLRMRQNAVIPASQTKLAEPFDNNNSIAHRQPLFHASKRRRGSNQPSAVSHQPSGKPGGQRKLYLMAEWLTADFWQLT